MNKNVDPLNELFPRRFLNSLWRVIVIFCQKKVIREGISQKYIGNKIIPKKVLIQLIEKEKIEEVGSKTENKFIIIFSLKI